MTRPRCGTPILSACPAPRRARLSRWLVSFALTLITIPPTVAENSIPEPSTQAQPDPWPAITPVRYGEDYSFLRDTDTSSGVWWEPLKFMPLDEAGNSYVSAGLEIRTRYEWLDNDNFGAGPQDDGGYGQVRVMPHLDARFPFGDTAHGDAQTRGFLQLIAAAEFGNDVPTSPVAEDRFDVLQAFGDLIVPLEGDQSIMLRGGRRIFGLGSERLVSKRYGVNVPRAFDGLFVILDAEGWTTEVFWARPVATETAEFDDSSNDNQSLWGVYATRPLDDLLPGTEQTGVDLYYLGFLDKQSVFAQNPGNPLREMRHTFGVRFFGQHRASNGTLDWNFEAMLQAGELGPGDILTWSIASDLGYTFDTVASPRVGIKANVISGDTNPSDANLQTFNPLFPRGTYFGELTPVGPYNLRNLQASLAIEPKPRWRATLQSGFYWRQSDDDGVYSITGGVIRAPAGSTDLDIGWQWDLLVEASLTRQLDLLLSYSQFHAGDFLEATGSSSTIHFAVAELLYRF